MKTIKTYKFKSYSYGKQKEMDEKMAKLRAKRKSNKKANKK